MRTRLALTSAMACALAACGTSHDGDDGPSDAASSCVPAAPERQVDLLLVLDNSNDMDVENLRLVEQLPSLFEALVAEGLDVHAGVVTSDMGTGGYEIPTCEHPHFGDDGILRTESHGGPGCTETPPPFLSFGPEDAGETDALAQDFTCVARVGTGGCGFEQPLEAMLKALAPSSLPVTFHRGTLGHGDRENAGFLREDSVLAVLLLTKETDCSVADPELFNPDTDVYVGNLSLRCVDYPRALHPMRRYADGLLALRPGGDRLAFAAIVGVPPDLTSADYDTMLADERMQHRLDAEHGRPVHSCMVSGSGLAFPPRRIVELAQYLDGWGAATRVESICSAGYGPAVSGLVAAIDEARAGTTCE